MSPAEAFLDLALETDVALLLCWPFLYQDVEAIGAMLADPVVLLGLADAGAHVGLTMDASAPTYLLSYWVRERGALAPGEAVRRLTSDTARTFGIAERGELRPGWFADVNVIDPARLALPVPAFLHDFARRGPLRAARERLRRDHRERAALHGGRAPHGRAGRAGAARLNRARRPSAGRTP